MNRTIISVIKSTKLRCGVNTVVGTIAADTLINRHKIAELDVKKETGYQRIVLQSRVNQLAAEIKDKQVDLPTAVLLNIRGVRFDDVLSRVNSNNDIYYTLDLGNESGKGARFLYVVDGQHRIKALKKARDEEGKNLKKFKLPFVCMIGGSEEQELKQFFDVNSNGKSVPTQITLEFIGDFPLTSVKARKWKWQVKAYAAAKMLEKSSAIWKDRIRLANMPKGKTLIPVASMVKSLEPLFRSDETEISLLSKPEQQMQAIDAYWQGIKMNLEEAFADPGKYSVQKGIGVRVLHGIFLTAIAHVRSKGGSIYSAPAYAEVLRGPLMEIKGHNRDNVPVKGIKFWKAGMDGAIGQYSSGAGIHALTQLLKGLFPEFKAK